MILRLAVLGAVAVVLWRLLADQGAAIVGGIRDIGLARLLASLALAILGMWCGWRAWYAVLAGLGVQLPSRPARRLFFVTQLGKYLPGVVWPVVMQAELAGRRGIRRSLMAAAYSLALIISVLAGGVVATATLVAVDRDTLTMYWWALASIPAGIMLLHPRVLPTVMSLALRTLGRPPQTTALSWGATASALAWTVGTWTGLGLHIAVLAGAFGPTTARSVATAVGAMTLAFVVGLLVVIAPAGAGARDVVLALVLAGLIPQAGVIAVVLVSRVVLLFADIALAALARYAPGS